MVEELSTVTETKIFWPNNLVEEKQYMYTHRSLYGSHVLTMSLGWPGGDYDNGIIIV